jgi:hypothetical protein
MTSRRKFIRPLGERRYRKLFIIAVEGTVTEPQYFQLFQRRDSVIHVACLSSKNGSSPHHVLAELKKYIHNEHFTEIDEAWLVVDKDMWTDAQLQELLFWSNTSENYGFALSNPKFEIWLLLHHEDSRGAISSQECSERLKRYIPNYNKGIDIRKITDDMILRAIERARQKDTPPCNDWPHTTGTTVYRLVERIIAPSP